MELLGSERLFAYRQCKSKEGVELSGGDIHTEEGRLIEAFSFYYARLVVCASEDERLLARWSQAEAARAEHLLIRTVRICLTLPIPTFQF